jgi:thioredoxin 1
MNKDSVQEISQNEFSKVINDSKNRLVVVDFFATWCFPCTMMAPIFGRLAEKYKDVKFVKIDVDNASNLADKYEISSIPCIIFFKEGKVVDKIEGSTSEEMLSDKIKDYKS